MKFAIFAKHLQSWPLSEAVERVAEAGFDGFDLTVRPGGYVEPEHLSRDLPAAVKLIRSSGLAVPLLTTGLISGDDAYAEQTLRSAGELGVRELKLHYWPWEGSTTLATAAHTARKSLDSLEKIAKSARVRVNIHNHSGDHVSNSPWTVATWIY